MKSVKGRQDVDARDLTLLGVLFAGVVGVVSLVLHDPSIDVSQVQPIRSAQASPRIAARVVPVAVRAFESEQAQRVTPEENWAPDESSHGLRPDAAH